MGLRERKKEQTRTALVDAATRLFTAQGYDKTTVKDIAAAAGVSTRTFFSYFRAKEDVLFAGTDKRLQAIAEAFDTVRADSPAQAVRRLLEHVLTTSDDLSDPDRFAIMFARPELQAQALRRLTAAQRMIAEWLRRTYPDRLDDPLSHAVSGAVVGTLVGTVLGGIERGDPPDELGEHLRRALTLLDGGLRALD
ncbi:TetR/AcrR family transcriptional regulator [Plantactinospora sp. GCM10030261]|uniref:TetR/AcrR family transcriptional regulator n=1 Tax=Plantactinospora sp. GCM10030261 TaxID=3273420 RepID=UPI0036225B5E